MCKGCSSVGTAVKRAKEQDERGSCKTEKIPMCTQISNSSKQQVASSLPFLHGSSRLESQNRCPSRGIQDWTGFASRLGGYLCLSETKLQGVMAVWKSITG